MQIDKNRYFKRKKKQSRKVSKKVMPSMSQRN